MKKIITTLILLFTFLVNNAQTKVCQGSGSTATINSSLIADGTYNVLYSLSGSNTLGSATASVVFSSGVGILTLPSLQLANTGLTTLSVISVANPITSCSTNFPTVLTKVFDVIALPGVSGVNSISVVQPLCPSTDAAVTLNSSGMANGTYTITYNLSGANTLGATTTVVSFAGGVANFAIPFAQIPNVGSTTVSVSSIVENTGTCSVPYATAVSGSFVVSPLPNVGGSNSLSVIQPLCPSTNAAVTLNSSAMVDGAYTITYTLSGVNTLGATTTVVSFAGGVANFAIPFVQIPNVGTTNILVTGISNNASACSVPYATAVSGSFVVSPLPNVGGTNSLSVVQPLCPNIDAAVTLNSSLITNGNYIITYTLSGVNTSGTTTASVNFFGGVANFAIPFALIPNVGTTNISVSGITNTLSSCVVAFPTSINGSFDVSPLPNVGGTNSLSVVQPLCPSTNAAVTLNSSAMTNGNYTITYTLSGANILGATTTTVSFVGGVANFSIPFAQIPNVGSTTVAVTSIVNSTSACSVPYATAVSGTFVVSPLPNVGGTNSISVVQPLCPASNANITLNASAMVDGTYIITYTLSGSNTLGATTAAVNFVGGVGNFSIPFAQIPNVGTTNISVTTISNSASACSVPFATTVNGSFIVSPLPNLSGVNSMN